MRYVIPPRIAFLKVFFQHTHNLVLYLAHETHTRVGRSTARTYEHEVVTGDGVVDTLLQATR